MLVFDNMIPSSNGSSAYREHTHENVQCTQPNVISIRPLTISHSVWDFFLAPRKPILTRIVMIGVYKYHFLLTPIRLRLSLSWFQRTDVWMCLFFLPSLLFHQLGKSLWSYVRPTPLGYLPFFPNGCDCRRQRQTMFKTQSCRSAAAAWENGRRTCTTSGGQSQGWRRNETHASLLLGRAVSLPCRWLEYHFRIPGMILWDFN